MAVLSASSIGGLILLTYLCSFVILAIIRITTGISIQRIGYLSLVRVAFTAREGIRFEARAVRLSLHRPTFAHPTWFSIRLEDPKILVNLSVLYGGAKDNTIQPQGQEVLSGAKNEESGSHDAAAKEPRRRRSQLWKRLTRLKECLKIIHTKLHWLKLFDIVAHDSVLEFVDVGRLQIGNLTAVVDTRRKTVDQGKLFRHKKEPSGQERRAEWILSIKNVFLMAAGHEPCELLESMSVNIHGILYQDRLGLRDSSIAVKSGRLHIPIDDLLAISSSAESISSSARRASVKSPVEEISFTDVVEELNRPGSREEATVETVADLKDFVSSMLRGVLEFQLALSFIRLSRTIIAQSSATTPKMLNVVTHEIGVDLHRLDQRSPAHRMYFVKSDIAHQALIAAISTSVGIDEVDIPTKKIMYVPMATITIKTTLPSKTVMLANDKDANERNANILFANIAITSPSIDLASEQLSQLVTIARTRGQMSPKKQRQSQRLISRLLPKASVKLSIQEPVVRFLLPVLETSPLDSDDYNLIISAVSSISLDLESSYSKFGELHYALDAIFRISSHELYYQTSTGLRHDLVIADTVDIKVHLSAAAEALVAIDGSFRRCAVHIIGEEVQRGIYNIVKHFDNFLTSGEALTVPETKHTNFLRRLPFWLVNLYLEGSDFSLEVGGLDQVVSADHRSIVIELESWTADYQSQRIAPEARPLTPRRMSFTRAHSENATRPTPTAQRGQGLVDRADDRRLTIRMNGMVGHTAELPASHPQEREPLVELPDSIIAFNTFTDQQGPVLHTSLAVNACYVHVSLHRVYSLGVALAAIIDALRGPRPTAQSVAVNDLKSPSHESHQKRERQYLTSSGHFPMEKTELLALDFKVNFLQVKMVLPADPPMLVQSYDMIAGRHRWASPFFRCHLFRIQVEPPNLRGCWARLVSANNIRLDLRQTRKKTGISFVSERSIDIAAECVRLSVPHSLTMYRVFDNLINTIKTIEQLLYRLKTRRDNFVLDKKPAKPKQIPKISFRSRNLMFELEDDPFEWKLGMVYRVGALEQKQRLARIAAFHAKVKKLREERRPRATSRHRAQSLHPPHKLSATSELRRRSLSHGTRQPPAKGADHHERRGRRQMRYHPEGLCDLTGSAAIQMDEAWAKLHEHNARMWKIRIDRALQSEEQPLRPIRGIFAAADRAPHNSTEDEVTLTIPHRPGLMAAVISDLYLLVDKPDFPVSECATFIHEVGKGMPYDMQYSLLIPMKVALDMGEAQVMLRDYPLKLLHVPPIKTGQSSRLASWSLQSNIVVAEEFRGASSSRDVEVEIVPAQPYEDNADAHAGYSVKVRRTVSPVKTFSKVSIDINTSLPTVFSWGTSYQPLIQNMMMIFEGFSKPELDPSDRVGFWDKIRLNFHSRLTINWKYNGDVHLRLKGSRDPYSITGYGAGFVMCWREGVRWTIHATDDPREFMTVTSGEYMLAIPDYSQRAHHSIEPANSEEGLANGMGSKETAAFSKVVMKLSGNVKWVAGVVFERKTDDQIRAFDFKPHYMVALQNPQYVAQSRLKDYDAYQGFRSHHIHLSLAVAAPYDRNWSFTNLVASKSYNTVHLSPRAFSHFFDWWSLFSGVMSIPIRQGKLWRGPEKSSKKFGRHLATFKYKLLLSPLFISHIYNHKDPEGTTGDDVAATGLKLRLDSFMLDLHQRREWFDTIVKGKSKQTRASAMRIHEGQLDFINADMRAVSAKIPGTDADDLLRGSHEATNHQQQFRFPVDLSRFSISDGDTSWIDMDDYVELGWLLPFELNPEISVLSLAFTPRFTYFRQTDHGGAIRGDDTRSSFFGAEPTHFCVMSHDNDPRRVQSELVKERIDSMKQRITSHTRLMGEQELRVVRDGHEDASLKMQFEAMVEQHKELLAKYDFLLAGLARLDEQQSSPTYSDKQPRNGAEYPEVTTRSMSTTEAKAHEGLDYLFPSSSQELSSDFDNRFMVHNLQLKWNNAIRNVIISYGHQVGKRRGFGYYMSRRAVKFILDIVNERSRAKASATPHSRSPAPDQAAPSSSEAGEKGDDHDLRAHMEESLNDFSHSMEAGYAQGGVDGVEPDASAQYDETKEKQEFIPQNSYHVRLIAPQIQLQSEKNNKAVAIISAKGMQLKVIAIMDKGRISDNISGLVQRQFSLDMDGAQFFITTQKMLRSSLHLYDGNHYGSSTSSSWPPWVSLEAMFDFELHPFGFERIIHKTSATLRYEKYNTLRLKYNEEVAGARGDKTASRQSENRMDYLAVDFPRIRARCDSSQYYALYIIVLDLLLYREPRERKRNERLEKIMLASDLTDLRGAPEMAAGLQERIRQLEEIKRQFQLHADRLDRQGWQDRLNLEKDLANCEEELFFVMEAITTSQSQRKSDDRDTGQAQGLLKWYLTSSEIVWHLMREKQEPLLELQLRQAAYERVDNSDGSNYNALEIGRIVGLNLLPQALYPEMIGPYHDPQITAPAYDQAQKMMRVQWFMLEAIAGIPVLEQFQIKLFPMRIQLEQDLGKKFFEYIFPGSHSDGFETGNFSPFMIRNMKPLQDEDDDDDDDDASDDRDTNGWTRTATLNQSAQGSLPFSDSVSSVSEAASMTRRMKPTLSLSNKEPQPSPNTRLRGLNFNSEHGRLGFWKHASPPSSSSRLGRDGSFSRKLSVDTLALTARTPAADPSPTSALSTQDELRRRSGLRASSSRERKAKTAHEPSDELSQMIARANNYMTLAHVKLDSVVICLSYKGKGDRNIEDLHNFVFRMPVLEYRNKTWSNLDLALRLKKDFIRALISHTGAIIGHKLHNRRGRRQQPAYRLHGVATSKQTLPSFTLANASATSDAGSMTSSYFYEERSTSPRRSFTSSNRHASPITTADSVIHSSLPSSRASSLATPRHRTSDSPRELTPSHPGLRPPPSRLIRRFSGESRNANISNSNNSIDVRGRQPRLRQANDVGDQDNAKKKNVLLLGKKILGSLG